MNTQVAKFLTANDAKFKPQEEQCNCACAGWVEKASRRWNLNDVYIRALEFHYQKIGCCHELAFTSQLGGGAAVLTSAGWGVLDSFRDPRQITPQDDQEVVRKMIDLGFLVVEDVAQKMESKLSVATLSAWLHLTDRCNLHCSYCYLPHVREDMSLETGRAALDALFRSAVAGHFKQVTVKYAGGEPLLRYPLIIELHGYAETLAERYGLVLEDVVLSNGTLLTGEISTMLKSLDIRLMISLDGYGGYHDRHRPYAGGRGSFVDVAEAVQIALTEGITPNISVTVSSRTAEGLPDILAWILERDLPFTLNFYRENELSAFHEDMRLDEEKIINGMLAAFKVIEDNLPRRPFLGGIIDRANLSASHTHTCGVGQNYLVFDQNGQIAKCQMQIREPITNVHVADPLAVIRTDRSGIQNISVEEKEGCKTCEWKYWCAGGCPLATYRATGRYDVKSPNCNIYKALYPEALRLEGLRLLKYQDDPEIVLKL
ncbi:MAG: radical SAM protein [Chloroflexota bacterium]